MNRSLFIIICVAAFSFVLALLSTALVWLPHPSTLPLPLLSTFIPFTSL
ncbi:hypothetical protein CVT24_002794 [Panaeolus cyanescens]|uniref:Uncharacterized protein n=1 Tax=Panaeolus cyanescens TaxID=181874 RepID=A0A409X3S7_9AGAR|nr:hypothetical protein CVT24_002794 [Panaeolus cyanescens]